MEIRQMQSHFAYDEWANAGYFDAVAGLTEDQFTRELTSSFPSIRDTLAHIVASEWVWLRRWEGESPEARPEWEPRATLGELRRELSQVETGRSVFLSSLMDEDLDGSITYRDLKGQQWTNRLADLCLHVVNHSSYHRGQLATLMRQVGATPPATDLVVFARQRTA